MDWTFDDFVSAARGASKLAKQGNVQVHLWPCGRIWVASLNPQPLSLGPKAIEAQEYMHDARKAEGAARLMPENQFEVRTGLQTPEWEDGSPDGGSNPEIGSYLEKWDS